MKKTEIISTTPSRRSFLKRVGAAATVTLGSRAAVGTPPTGKPQADSPSTNQAQSTKPFIGIQVGAVSFVDEGVDNVLDILQGRAGVNALMLAVFTYGRGIAGRQVPGQPLPDHGAQEYDTGTFHGGSYTAVHPEYYGNTIFKDFRAPDLGDFDLLASVVPKAKTRGMKTYCWYEDVYNQHMIPDFGQVAEVDVYGHRTGQACLNNPEVRQFVTALPTDWVKSSEVDGIMWGSERQGPLNNAIGSRHGGFNGHASITCFCEYCQRKGRERGIDVTRARQGFLELDKWVHAAWKDPRPGDGYFVTFWRLLLNYPEILAWEKLWTDSQQEVYADIHHAVKSINKNIQVGWHIWHNNSFSPFYRAEQDYTKLRQNADFLKVVMYNNCAGPRFAEYIRNAHSTVFRDAPPDAVLALHYSILGYQGEASLDQLPTAGLSADYVARETRRAVAGVGSGIAIHPGIDIDIPTGKGEKKTQPSDVTAAVKAALTSGAQGVILSRKYSEMRLVNLAAAGEALRELGYKV